MPENDQIHFAKALSEVDPHTGFRYRTVYLNDENSKLHYHDYYEVFLILAPHVIHHINSEKMDLPRGTLVFIRKEDRHMFEYTAAKEPSFCNLTFHEQILQELFQFLGKGYPSEKLLSQPMPPSAVLDEGETIWFQEQLKHLNSVSTVEEKTLWELAYRCRLFLFQLFTRFFVRGISDADRKDIPLWLTKLNAEMSRLENFSKGSAQMVRLSGRSPDYLGRMVKKYYGVTTSEYINQLRLNYFANTLVTDDIPILDLCYECGFQNVSYAYSLFKKKYGMPPLKYRKMHR